MAKESTRKTSCVANPSTRVQIEAEVVPKRLLEKGIFAKGTVQLNQVKNEVEE